MIVKLIKSKEFLVFAALIVIFYLVYVDNVLSNKSNKNVSLQRNNCMFTNEEVVQFENGFSNAYNRSYLKYVSQQWMLKPSGEKLKLKKRMVKNDFSQIGQSLYVNTLLNNKTKGFYVECGAADGEFISNSLYFEINLNWTGLLIEPNPQFFQQLLKVNRNAYLSNVCINNRGISEKQVFLDHSWWGGITDNTKKIPRKAKRISVQCFPLHVLLMAVGVKQIDYFSLDVEGAELNILKTIPFDKLTIDVIGIEYRDVNFKKTKNRLKRIRKFFNKLDLYEEVGILPNKTGTKAQIEGNGLDVFFKRK